MKSLTHSLYCIQVIFSLFDRLYLKLNLLKDGTGLQRTMLHSLVSMALNTLILFVKHKGLRAYWDRGDVSKLNPKWIPRIERIMNALDIAKHPDDLNFPGWRLHLLKGNFAGHYSLRLTGNWRIVFRFAGTDVTDIDLIDYH